VDRGERKRYLLVLSEDLLVLEEGLFDLVAINVIELASTGYGLPDE
jgi:hypothetical protein